MLLSTNFFNFAVSFAIVNLLVVPGVGYLVFDLTNLRIKLQTFHFLVGVMITIHHLAGIPNLCWFNFLLKEITSPYPTLLYDSTTNQFHLLIEGNRIAVDDAQNGMCSSVAAYWAFNICFNVKCQKFLSFVAHYLLGLQSVTLPMSVVRFINFL